MTCGHIFRDSQGNGKILIDVFGPQPVQKLEGVLVSYDIKRDVGLIRFRPGVPVTVAPDRSSRTTAAAGRSGGQHRLRSWRPADDARQVNSLNKFLGPANVQVAGQPVQGRSGGGLFDAQGQVVGVCNAADPADNEGLFAARPHAARRA